MSNGGGQKVSSKQRPCGPDILILPAAGAHRLTVWLLHLQLPLCVRGQRPVVVVVEQHGPVAPGGSKGPCLSGGPPEQALPPSPLWTNMAASEVVGSSSNSYLVPGMTYSGGKIYPVGYFTKERAPSKAPRVPSRMLGPRL